MFVHWYEQLRIHKLTIYVIIISIFTSKYVYLSNIQMSQYLIIFSPYINYLYMWKLNYAVLYCQYLSIQQVVIIMRKFSNFHQRKNFCFSHNKIIKILNLPFIVPRTLTSNKIINHNTHHETKRRGRIGLPLFHHGCST